MVIEIAGFAQALSNCLAFETIDANELEQVLGSGRDPLEMRFIEPSADEALIQSGEPFDSLFFVLHGTIVPWQYPYSELSSPFLIGDHEFMMNADRWVASYSAITQATVVRIPVPTMQLARERIPDLGANIYSALLRRMSRYYWVSLATNGSPAHRVAAALISRLALIGADSGTNCRINIRQQDIVRLTVMSRSAVASAISRLSAADLIGIGDDERERFSGVVLIPDVDKLKHFAFSEVREKQVRPLLRLVDL